MSYKFHKPSGLVSLSADNKTYEQYYEMPTWQTYAAISITSTLDCGVTKISPVYNINIILFVSGASARQAATTVNDNHGSSCKTDSYSAE